MPHRRYAALVCLGVSALARAAVPDPCTELPKPAVVLERVTAKPTENTRYGVGQLNALGHQENRPGRTILGLTRGQAVTSYALKLPGYRDASGRWECVSPQITVRYGFSPMTVYVAREFPAGSCAHGEIHAHEMRHVAAYAEHIAAIEANLTQTLQRRFNGTAPWRGPAGEIAEKLRKELDERWLPYLQREIAKVDTAQARIDTDEEYERVAASCKGEITQKLAALPVAGKPAMPRAGR